MKKLIIIALVMIGFISVQAQTDYKVVFDMTNKDSASHETVIRQAGGIAKANADAQVQVVIYSGALDMVVQGKSTVAAKIENLIKNKQVSFKVCKITMERNKVDASQLIPGVEVVADGIYEIITKQRQGWGYIKVGN